MLMGVIAASARPRLRPQTGSLNPATRVNQAGERVSRPRPDCVPVNAPVMQMQMQMQM